MKKEAPLVYPQERLESGMGEGRYGRDIESTDDQLCNRVPLILSQVPVDIICTPTRVIFTNTPIPKPKGICWNKLSPEKLGQIQIHRELKSRIEQETGKKLPCGTLEKLPPTSQRR